MGINFDALPTTGSQNVLISGKHRVLIKKAEMKLKNDNSGEYLNILLEAFDETGASLGTFFTVISDSEKNLPRYILRRFIEGFKLPIKGEFELKDLTKIVVGKEAYADLKIDENEGYQPKTVVDASNDVFYPIENPTEVAAAMAEAEDELPPEMSSPKTPIPSEEEEEF